MPAARPVPAGLELATPRAVRLVSYKLTEGRYERPAVRSLVCVSSRKAHVACSHLGPPGASIARLARPETPRSTVSPSLGAVARKSQARGIGPRCCCAVSGGSSSSVRATGETSRHEAKRPVPVLPRSGDGDLTGNAKRSQQPGNGPARPFLVKLPRARAPRNARPRGLSASLEAATAFHASARGRPILAAAVPAPLPQASTGRGHQPLRVRDALEGLTEAPPRHGQRTCVCSEVPVVRFRCPPGRRDERGFVRSRGDDRVCTAACSPGGPRSECTASGSGCLEDTRPRWSPGRSAATAGRDSGDELARASPVTCASIGAPAGRCTALVPEYLWVSSGKKQHACTSSGERGGGRRRLAGDGGGKQLLGDSGVAMAR